MSKLVAYFSASGTTKKRAEELARVAGAALYEIAPSVKYTSADLDWMNNKSRSSLEMQDPSCRPELAESQTDLSAYDTVYIGFPIWWYTVPQIIRTFLEHHDLSGKKIVLFATSGGSSIDRAMKEIKKNYPALNITGGKLLNGRVSKDIA